MNYPLEVDVTLDFLLVYIWNTKLNPISDHFTQIVWKSTVEFGIGKAHTRGGKLIVVANYRPAGNTIGGFHENVLPLIKDDSSKKSTDDNTDDMDSLNETSIQSQSLLNQ